MPCPQADDPANQTGPGLGEQPLGFQRLSKSSPARMIGWDPKGCWGSRVIMTFLSHIPRLSPSCLM